MGSPNRNSLAVIDPILSNLSLEYTQEKLVTDSGNAFGMCADFIMPRVPHNIEGLTGRYFTYNLANRFTLPAASLVRRASGTDYHKIDWNVSSDNYHIEDYGLGKDWDDNEVSAQLSPVDLMRDSNEIVTDLTLLDYARRVNTIATNASVVTQTSTAAALNGIWSSGGSNPIKDINTAINTIYKATGRRPNRMVVGWDVWNQGLLDNDEILSRLPDSMTKGNADINPMLVGQKLFGLDMRVDTTLINSAVEGQTASLSTTATGAFGKNVLVFWADPSPRVKKLTFATTFWKEWFKTRTWDTNPKMHTVAVSHMTSEKVNAAACAYLITSAVA